VTSRGEERVHTLSATCLPHKLYLKINQKIVKGSPHTVIVRQNLQDLGNPVKVFPGLNRPWDVTTDRKGQIVVTESEGHCVSIFSPEWDKIQSLGSGSSSSTEGQFNHPTGVTVSIDDHIHIVDCFNHRIQKFPQMGGLLLQLAHVAVIPSSSAYLTALVSTRRMANCMCETAAIIEYKS